MSKVDDWHFSTDFLKPPSQYPTKLITVLRRKVYHNVIRKSKKFTKIFANGNTAFTTMCKPLIALNKTRLDFAGKHQKEIALFWKTFFCQMKPRWTYNFRITEKKRNCSWAEAYHIICHTRWKQCYRMSMCSCQWTRPTSLYWWCDCW